jgi:hypothetical protein
VAVAAGGDATACAALAYVLERVVEDGAREGGTEYRLWVGEDIRAAAPAGVVLLRNGSRGALWRRDGTTYVKALGEAEADPEKVASNDIGAAAPVQIRQRRWLRW